MTRRWVVVVVMCAALLPASLAVAHWCSNIFVARARFVVKPEKTTVYVGNQPVSLRVYLQNNFPYKLFDVEMRGVASGYSFSVSPQQQDVHPGQNVSYMFTITRTTAAAGNLSTNALIQMQFRLGSWRTSTDSLVAQNPTQSTLVNMSTYGGAGSQTASVNAATLADFFPTATLPAAAPFFGRTGIEQLAHWFGYPFCYSYGSSWRCGAQDCPNPCAEGAPWTGIDQFPQHCMRAGAELAARKAELGSHMTYAQDAVVNALTGGGDQHRCLAAVVGGLLWQGVASPNDFTTTLAASSIPAICKSAGTRTFDGSGSSSCSSGQYYERAACAAAEGLNNNNGPVTSVLMPNAGDGSDGGGYPSLYYAYMLYIVQANRKATTGSVSFYPDAGVSSVTPPDQAVTPPDQTVIPPDQAVTPPDQTVTPPDQTVTPPDQTVIPPDQTVTPPDQTVTPPDQTVTPPQDTQPWPGDQTVAHDQQPAGDSTTPGDSVAAFDGFKPSDSFTPSETGIVPDADPGTKQSGSLEGGCGCNLGHAPESTGALLIGLLLLLGLCRRKQRKRCPDRSSSSW